MTWSIDLAAETARHEPSGLVLALERGAARNLPGWGLRYRSGRPPVEIERDAGALARLASAAGDAYAEALRAVLAEAGAALHGERFVAPLARELGVQTRTVERWLSGVNLIPADLPRELAALLRARGAAVTALLARLPHG